MLRYSVRVDSPGSISMVLEAISQRPPYLLENRTPHPLFFRPLVAAATTFQQLPPHSAAGYAPLVTGSPQMVRAVGQSSQSPAAVAAACSDGSTVWDLR